MLQVQGRLADIDGMSKFKAIAYCIAFSIPAYMVAEMIVRFA